MNLTINITFKGGLGETTVKWRRNGIEQGSGNLNQSGDLKFDDVIRNDTVRIKGISPAGGTEVRMNLETDSKTPFLYDEGAINGSFTIIS